MNTPSCLVLPVHKAVVAVVTESCVFGKYRHVCVHTALQGVHHSVHQLKCLLVSIRSEVDYVQMQSAMSTLGNVGKMLSCPVQTNLHAALPLLIHSFHFFCQDQFQLGYIQMQSAVSKQVYLRQSWKSMSCVDKAVCSAPFIDSFVINAHQPELGQNWVPAWVYTDAVSCAQASLSWAIFRRQRHVVCRRSYMVCCRCTTLLWACSSKVHCSGATG